MRASLQHTITGLLALLTGALVFAFASGASATELRDGSYMGELASSVPTNLSPLGGGTVEYPVQPIALTWDAVPGANNYEVEIASDANGICDTQSAFSKTVAATKTHDTGYVPDMVSEKSGKDIVTGDYCWHVRAVADTPADGSAAADSTDSPGEWSTAARFSVVRTIVPTNLRFYNDTDGQVPRTPADSDYATGSSSSRNSGYLHWDAVPGATGYDVQVSHSASFNVSVISTDGNTSTDIVLPWLADEDSYYWHVRAAGGPWSATSSFKIQRFSSTWLNNTSKYPAYNAATNDYLVGWNPVPGASYYEVQATTSANCFWERDQAIVSVAYADQANGCRISSTDVEHNTTVNNWASARTLIDDVTRVNVANTCVVPASSPAVDDESLCTKDYPSTVFWRVRPIWQTLGAHESLWGTVADQTMYGAWLQDDTLPRPNMFHPTRAVAYDSVAATDNRCSETPDNNPIAGNNCLHLIPGTVSPSDASTSSTTLQLPLLKWGAVDGSGSNTGPGGYRIQIAHDPFFNDVVVNEPLPTRTSISTPELSFSPRTSLPDDEDGYWWRVIPCESAGADMLCNDYYYSGAPGLSSAANVFGANAYSDGAEPQVFTKHVVSTTKVSDMGDTAPLLSIASAGASTAADWSRGIQGSEYYQFQISRTPTFATVGQSTPGPDTIDTSQPRIQPYFKGSTAARERLAGGRWYWRARGVDHNGIPGGWSDTSQFNVTLEAPVVTGGNGAMGAGVVGTWDPVRGATSYRVEYSTSANFSGTVTTVNTSQLGFRVPSDQLGVVYWRVRGEGSASDLVNAAVTPTKLIGAWSSVASANIVPQTRLRYGTSVTTAKAGAKVTFEGQLSVNGGNVNGQIVQLQRKTTSCDASGSYVTIAKGKTVGDGRASIPAKVLQNACYRLTYAGASALYSAPFAVNVKPVIKAKIAKKKRKLSRGTKSCVKFGSNRVLNGTVTFEFKRKVKGASWTKISSGRIYKFKKAKYLCFRINGSGSMTLRATFSNMAHPTGHWSQYADTTISLGSFKVNNVWVKKSKKKHTR
jgi:hypothetical protein